MYKLHLSKIPPKKDRQKKEKRICMWICIQGSSDWLLKVKRKRAGEVVISYCMHFGLPPSPPHHVIRVTCCLDRHFLNFFFYRKNYYNTLIIQYMWSKKMTVDWELCTSTHYTLNVYMVTMETPRASLHPRDLNTIFALQKPLSNTEDKEPLCSWNVHVAKQ